MLHTSKIACQQACLTANMNASVFDARPNLTQHRARSIQIDTFKPSSATPAGRRSRTLLVQAVVQPTAVDAETCPGLAITPTLANQSRLKRLKCNSVQPEVQAFTDTATSRQPDLQFEHASGVQVCVFGVEHLEREAHIGQPRRR